MKRETCEAFWQMVFDSVGVGHGRAYKHLSPEIRSTLIAIEPIAAFVADKQGRMATTVAFCGRSGVGTAEIEMKESRIGEGASCQSGTVLNCNVTLRPWRELVCSCIEINAEYQASAPDSVQKVSGRYLARKGGEKSEQAFEFPSTESKGTALFVEGEKVQNSRLPLDYVSRVLSRI